MSDKIELECCSSNGQWSGKPDLIPGEQCTKDIIARLKRGEPIYVRILDEFIEPTEIK